MEKFKGRAEAFCLGIASASLAFLVYCIATSAYGLWMHKAESSLFSLVFPGIVASTDATKAGSTGEASKASLPAAGAPANASPAVERKVNSQAMNTANNERPLPRSSLFFIDAASAAFNKEAKQAKNFSYERKGSGPGLSEERYQVESSGEEPVVLAPGEINY